MWNKFVILYAWFVRSTLYFLPDIPFIMRFRGFLYSLCMKKCGVNFQVAHNVLLTSLSKLSVGSNVRIATFCRVIGSGNIVLLDEINVGTGTILVSGNHVFNGRNFRDLKGVPGDILIGNGCWIGGNCTITANSKIPSYSIIAANSCVTAKMGVEEYGVYGGVPAKFLKKHYNND